MGKAREVMDRVTQAVFSWDADALAKQYAADAVAITPDAGQLSGREQIVGYFKTFVDAFPDAQYEPEYTHEAGNTAIDEGYFFGTNTQPLQMPTGEHIPATGKRVRVRSCDVATVDNGLITSHRLYFDQMDFLGQLGLLPDVPA